MSGAQTPHPPCADYPANQSNLVSAAAASHSFILTVVIIITEQKMPQHPHPSIIIFTFKIPILPLPLFFCLLVCLTTMRRLSQQASEKTCVSPSP